MVELFLAAGCYLAAGSTAQVGVFNAAMTACTKAIQWRKAFHLFQDIGAGSVELKLSGSVPFSSQGYGK